MNVLILGGTAFFGKEIAREFQSSGHEVTLFTRGRVLPTDLPPHHHLIGDRAKIADLKRAAAAARWDLVIDNIAFTAEDVKGALSVFQNVGRYLFCSTVSVYRYAVERKGPLQEASVDYQFKPPQEDLSDEHWKYAFDKKEAERVLVEQAKIPWTILRPPVVYGPQDITARGYWYLARLEAGGPILLADGGRRVFRLAYSRDVARAFFLAAQTPKTIGKTYNIAQLESKTLKDFIVESARALGKTPELIDVPLEEAGPCAGPFATMIDLLPEVSLAVKDFGFSDTPFATFVGETAKWFSKHWKGDRAKLLATRQEEITLASKWRKK